MLQPDQINMAVSFWYLVKCDLSSIKHCTVAYTKQISFYQKVPETHGQWPCITGHPVL